MFNGQHYSTSGTYTATLTNAVGCDSVVTLNLIVNPAVQITAQPQDSLTLAEGSTGNLTVGAIHATAYRWQRLTGTSWSDLSNGATYSGVTTAALGIVADLSLNGVNYRVVVSGAAGCSADTSTIAVLTVTPVAAVRLSLNAPADVVAGGVRAAYRVSRLNSLNNPAGGPALSVTLSSDPTQGEFYNALTGGQLLTQVVIPQDSTGADFWFTSTVASQYQIQASAGGLSSATDTIVVNAGAAKGIRILAQDTAVVGDSVLLTGVIIDSLGNPTVLAVNIRVRLTSTDPTGIFIPDTIIPVAAGSSTYAYQYRSFISGMQTITATWLIEGTNNPNPARTVGTKAIYFLPGDAVSLDVLTQPADSAVTGVVLGRQPVVVLRDAYGNRVMRSGVAVAARVIPTGAVLTGNTVVFTGTSGEAAYGSLVLRGTTGNYRLVFASAGLGSDTSTAVYLLCPTSATTISQAICAPDSFLFNGQHYSTSGTYTATLTNGAGCDSIVTLNLTVNQQSTSVVNRDICQGDSVNFNGVIYFSGAHTIVLTNSVGCDSVISLNINIIPCTINIGVKVFIQGYYDTLLNEMKPLLYNLGRSIDSIATDTITLSLWSPVALSAPVFSQKAILNKYGIASINIPDSFSNNAYFVSVNHRNSFEIWSALPVVWTDSIIYDFSDNLSRTYSNGFHNPVKVLESGVFGMYSGDVNQDDVIDALDLNLSWISSFNSPGVDYWISDLNADGFPDAQDIDVLWLNSFGSFAVARPY
ncbi:MAG: hypothetical protein EBS53_10655 [Bacteroidetes bacterium]|nr:hypothetical protein [Bacteroidota bacterium]